MRKDIQGLRAIAVIAVLLYHFWPSHLTGGYVGVDIFFVISGFLITGHLLKKPPISAHKLADFWARRIKRLLPAASFVLLVTLVAGLVWLPDTMIHTLLKETASAAVYVENWTLAATATDYLSSQNAPSPIQHFWSLSVEEQFYMIWPILIGGAFLLAKRLKQDHKKFLWFGLSSLFVISLIYSIYLTQQDAAAAYFVTPTRMWELSLGGLVALLSIYELKKMSGYLSASLAWTGLAMIAVSLLLFTEQTPFPGYTALLPTVGTALVILAAADGVKWSPGRLLGLKISQFFGDISYSLYLWHWPTLIIAPYALGLTLHAMVKLALVALAIALSALMKRFIEDPVRFHPVINRRKLTTYAYGLASMALVVTASLGTLQYQNVAQAHAVAQINQELSSNSSCIGAAAMKNKSCLPMGKDLITPSSYSKTDKPDVYSDGCWSLRPYTDHKVCSYGDKKSTIRIALVGNSHAGHWSPPVRQAATNHDWKLDTYLVSECYTVTAPLEFDGVKSLEDNCVSWNNWAIDSIARGNYDLVIMSDATHQKLKDVPTDKQLQVAQIEYSKTIKRFTDAHERVLVIRDVPEGLKNIPDCVAAHHEDPGKCNNSRNKAIKPDPLYTAAQHDKTGLVSSMDIFADMCDQKTCYTTIGGIIAYFDHGHLSKSFAKTLTPDISKAIAQAIK